MSAISPLGSTEPLQLALLALAFIAGMLRGFSGFGSALLIVPVLGLTIGLGLAVAIATLLEGVATLLLLPAALRQVHWRVVLPIVLSAAAMTPLGHALLFHLDPTITNLLISLAVAAMAVAVLVGPQLHLPNGPSGQVPAGALSGFLTGFGAIGGPPLVLFVLATEGRAGRKRAHLIAIAGLNLGVALVSLGLHGGLTRDAWVGLAFLAPPFFVGGIVGARLFQRASDRIFQRIALGSLVATSVLLFGVNLARLVP